MNEETTQTDRFEVHLERGRGSVSRARDLYSTLKLTDVVPDTIVEAIGELEREIDELDQTLEVTPEDVRLADRTASRATALAAVFAALDEQQRLVVEADLARLQSFVSILEDAGGRDATDDGVESRLDSVDRRLSMLEKLADSGRHGQVLGNDRVSPSILETDLRELDSMLADGVADERRATAYLAGCDNLLDEIHRTLGELDDQNPDRTAFSTGLGAVKERLDDAEATLGDDAGRAATQARIALEGTFMLHQSTARARARQQVATELAAVVEEMDEPVDCDPGRCASRGDLDTLLSTVDELVSAGIQRSAGERVQQLLREHDGSVGQTVQATDLDVATVVDQLEQLYRQQQIADIEVVFDR